MIEIVEDKPYEQILDERIFKPAGMQKATSETGQQLMSLRAKPYHLGADNQEIVVVHAPYKDLRFLTGAGSVYATAFDLLQFLRAMHDGIFGAGLWEEAVGDETATWRGWTGRINGYNAYMDILPAEDISYVFVSSLQSVVNWQVRDRIRALLMNKEIDKIQLPPPVAKAFEAPASLVGIYDNNGFPVVILLKEGKLFRGDNEFYPITGRRYYIPASGSIMAFRRDNSGTVDAIVWTRGTDEIILPRVPARD